MNLKGTKFVRFADWHSEGSTSSEREFSTDGRNPRRARPSLNEVMSSVRRGFNRGSDRFKTSKKPLSPGKQPAKEQGPRKNILDPQGSFLQTWNKIFVISCVIAVSLDPLFLYTSVVDGTKKCLGLDKDLQIVSCVLRSFTDVFHILHIIFQFRTGFIAPSSRVFGRGELNDDPVAIAKRYLCSYFIIDVLAILPLPQVVVFFIVPIIETPVPIFAKNLLTIVIVCQYVPRLIRIYPLYKEVTATSGFLTETAWAAAAFNLLLYMLASHVVGAVWYLFSIDREYRCWRDHCELDIDCKTYLYCVPDREENQTIVDMLKASCPFTKPDDIKDSSVFNFGIFAEALESGVMETTDFPKKFLYCFWWGLRSLSSLGQNLKTSTFVWEILFAVFISIFGLVLFSLLIGNMQKFLQSTTVRVEEMRVKRRDAEQWMSHRMLPEKLRERIRRYDQYKWQETRGVEEDTLVRNLPKDLRKDIKRHLCLALLKRVPMFGKMDDRLMDALCDLLKPVLFPDNSFIIREGDPVDEMLFIMRGNLATMTTNGGRTGFFNCADLKAGDFCGEELLTWALDPKSTSNLPLSTRTVEARTEVEAFALRADDLKFVASQFRRLHSRQVQHAFRFYSMQWRTWATCFIQAAWRRHCKRKLDKSLREAEDKLHYAFAEDAGTSPSLVATVYASRFATNALRALRQKGGHDTRPLPALLPLLPPKPTEPDFTEEQEE
ncbi:putative cyclic nucleotide-gated ion channel 13 isoform X1 [Argentina anserina]|nr:putative cyclic nucleotide-gated ion channel 13 isoform X1 [Potentilla anserina]XP_050384862.1 putative cyclic nucleotide-gated ion channel 13 isoform X1 [Potentilla anserina]XP_050384864.1 putative cyclic nucleotide-gated ion channel 13 isoform X1 [Potentilla anserina]